VTPPALEQIPVVGDVVGPAVTKLVAVRPTVAQHLRDGRYGTIVTGWRGQFEVLRAYLVRNALASRLSCEGQELDELTSSEFDTDRDRTPRAAVGEVILVRLVVHAVADATIAAANATDEPSAFALVDVLYDKLAAHRASVFDASTALGAHGHADTMVSVRPGWVCSIVSLVAWANDLKMRWNQHTASRGGVHPFVNAEDQVDYPDAVADWTGAGNWADGTLASQQSILGLLTAVKAKANQHLARESRGGIIPAGTTVTVTQMPGGLPGVTGGTYKTTLDAVVRIAAIGVSLPIQADNDGAGANLPVLYSAPGVLAPPSEQAFASPRIDQSELFDTSFMATSIRAAGGMDGQSDADLRRIARAYHGGRNGPNRRALIAGALRYFGAAHAVVLDDEDKGTAWLYVTDASWAQSDRWRAECARFLTEGADGDGNPWLGWGCRLGMGDVVTLSVCVDVTVTLRDAKYLLSTDRITAAIRQRVRWYFDERRDWYVWRAMALRGLISHVDQRILMCSSVVVRSSSGAVLTEPHVPNGGDALVHYALVDSAVEVAYAAP
jgi:hypothetical protein